MYSELTDDYSDDGAIDSKYKGKSIFRILTPNILENSCLVLSQQTKEIRKLETKNRQCPSVLKGLLS